MVMSTITLCNKDNQLSKDCSHVNNDEERKFSPVTTVT